ncbi:MAG: nitrogenase iron-molybdenum cofactor biosynthesis protein NifN, partial [Planctomycetota bacterium]
GSFETGYAAAVEAMIRTLVPTKTAAQPARSLGHCKKKHEEKITVLAGPGLAIGDVEWIKETIEAFGLTPILVPDLSDSLDGHLTDRDFSPVSVGGTPVSVFNTLQESIGTLVVGGSLNKAADVLAERTGVVDERFDHLQGLAATDRFLMTLSDWSQRDVPPAFARRRSQLQDAMLDTHFMISDSRLAIAADPDVLLGFADLIAEMGGNLVAAVTASSAARLTRVDVDRVQVGDLEDLESIAKAKKAELLISNSHALASATRLGVPLLRAGFPQYDHLGGYARCWSGYRASRQTLFDLANLLTESRHNQLEPYRSELSVKDPTAMPASTCQTPLVLESGHVA